MNRTLLSFHAFTKTNENLEYEETAAPASTSGTAAAPSDTLTESEEEKTPDLDFGEGDTTPTPETAAPESSTVAETIEPNEGLLAKLNQMIGVLNSHRNYLKSQDSNEDITKKINTLFNEFNKVS